MYIVYDITEATVDTKDNFLVFVEESQKLGTAVQGFREQKSLVGNFISLSRHNYKMFVQTCLSHTMFFGDKLINICCGFNMTLEEIFLLELR